LVRLRAGDAAMSEGDPSIGSPKRILIIHTDGNSFNNPSLKCIIDLLLEKGCQIDLRYPRSGAPMPTLRGIRFLPFGKVLRRIKSIVFDRLGSRWLATLCVFAEKLVLYRSYDLIIGVDRQGLIEAGILHVLTRTPHAFMSFEIMFESETSSRYKALEREASKSASLWVVQDEARARQLQIENGLHALNRFLLPLASAGPGSFSTPRLRDRLLVPQGMKVAIAIGSVSGWSMIDRVLKSVAGWPRDWALIVHERYGRTKESLRTELAQAAHLIGQRIFISDSATEMVDDMGGVLSGVSVGLAFYEPDFKGPYTGKNLEHLGMASGKISTYLRYCVPVILNDIGLYPAEARRFGFGRVVESPEHIAEHLDRCCDEHYRSCARSYFLRKLDFNIHAQELWLRIRDLMATTESHEAEQA
jgi:hypothetical protein